MPTNIGRVKVHEVVRRKVAQSISPVLNLEFPILVFENLPNPSYLVNDLGNIRLTESLWFVAVWYVEPTFAVEANHSVETGTIEKKKVK